MAPVHVVVKVANTSSCGKRGALLISNLRSAASQTECLSGPTWKVQPFPEGSALLETPKQSFLGYSWLDVPWSFSGLSWLAERPCKELAQAYCDLFLTVVSGRSSNFRAYLTSYIATIMSLRSMEDVALNAGLASLVSAPSPNRS